MIAGDEYVGLPVVFDQQRSSVSGPNGAVVLPSHLTATLPSPKNVVRRTNTLPVVSATYQGTPLMMMNAGAAAAAHAQRVRQMQCEEEQMTPYDPRDLADDWEFKILRSATGGFRKPERLARILDEEARAGWMLVEKFDNQRVRLKRRAEARKNDRQLDFDPYRSHVGTSEGQVVAVGIAIVFAVIFAFVLLANLLR